MKGSVHEHWPAVKPISSERVIAQLLHDVLHQLCILLGELLHVHAQDQAQCPGRVNG